MDGIKRFSKYAQGVNSHYARWRLLKNEVWLKQRLPMNPAYKELFQGCKNHSIKNEFKFWQLLMIFIPILNQRLQNGHKRGRNPASLSKGCQNISK
jgi:hypothetical protein